MYEYPDRFNAEKIPDFYAYMMTGITVVFNALAWGRRIWTLNGIGWKVLKLTVNILIAPAALVAMLRTFFWPDVETVNWLTVLFANIALLGPLGLYWFGVIMIPIGFITGFSVSALIKWLFIAVVSWAASVFQVAWIDNVRAIYTGSMFTADFILKKGEQIQSDLVDKATEIVDDFVNGDNADAEESELEL